MQNLLDYNDPDFEDIFCLNFEITTDAFDQQKVYELIPGGKDIPVTLKNRYVTLMRLNATRMKGRKKKKGIGVKCFFLFTENNTYNFISILYLTSR